MRIAKYKQLSTDEEKEPGLRAVARAATTYSAGVRGLAAKRRIDIANRATDS